MAQLQVLPNVACCICGIGMQPNQSRMCVQCLRGQVDVTEGISRQLVVQRCKQCTRWVKPPLVYCEFESKELLALCLKKIKGLSSVRLVDAAFIWTEPNSKQLKVKITVQKEVVHGAVLQQNVTINFVIVSIQCDDCKKHFTPHTWNANVQVRQKVQHKRTLLLLEQLILKHDAHEKVTNVVDVSTGLDFHFVAKQHADKFADFVSALLPVKKTMSKQLVSHDAKCNTYYHKFTIGLELCPICQDDLVILTPKLASQLGGASSLLLCHKISTAIHLIDPLTLRFVDIQIEKYWKARFESVLTRRHLTDFIVLDIIDREVPQVGGNKGVATSRGSSSATSNRQSNAPVSFEEQQSATTTQPRVSHNKQSSRAAKFRLVQAEIARASDFGSNDERVVVWTHLGNSIRPGDYCQGYDFRTVNLPSLDQISSNDADKLISNYDVILIKKIRPLNKNQRQRKWVLQTLQKDPTDATMTVHREQKQRRAADMEDFMRQLEEDSELRKDVNMWKDPRAALDPSVANSEDEDFGGVDVAELLEGLTLEDTKGDLLPLTDAAAGGGDDVDVEMI